MTVINPRTGKEFIWDRHKWSPTTRARWHKKTIGGKTVNGSVRSIAHLDWMDARAKAIFGRGVEVIQSAFNTGVKASAGTHDYDMVFDLYIPGVPWWRQQMFFRNHGFWCWYRHAPLFGNHIHGICMPPFSGDPSKIFMERGFKVGVYIDGGYSLYGRKVASSQVDDWAHKAFGLSEQHRANSDKSFFPPDPHKVMFNLTAYIKRRTAVQKAA